MATGLIDIIKRTTLGVMSNEQLCDLRYGTVVDASPLKIQVTNALILPSSVLVVPERLTNYTVSIKDNVSFETKTITINNALKVGDKVALLRKHGGQSYFILDRI